MKKFLILYKSDRPASEIMASSSPEQVQSSMNEWIKWKEEVGKDQFEWGLPLDKAVEITAQEVAPKENKIGGYSIMEGESLEEVAEKLKSHPHLKMMEGNRVVLLEMLPMPGM